MNFDEMFEKDDKYDIIKKKLNETNPLETTPLEALNILYELKKEIEKIG